MEAAKTGRDQWDSHSKSYNWVKAKEMVQVEEAAVAAEKSIKVGKGNCISYSDLQSKYLFS